MIKKPYPENRTIFSDSIDYNDTPSIQLEIQDMEKLITRYQLSISSESLKNQLESSYSSYQTRMTIQKTQGTKKNRLAKLKKTTNSLKKLTTNLDNFGYEGATGSLCYTDSKIKDIDDLVAVERMLFSLQENIEQSINIIKQEKFSPENQLLMSLYSLHSTFGNNENKHKFVSNCIDYLQLESKEVRKV